MTTRARQNENPPTGDENPSLTDPTDPHAPDGGNHPSEKPASTERDPLSEVFLIVVRQKDGSVSTEFHTGETAESYVSGITYGSRQHRKAFADANDGADLPEGGGSHEINRRDVRVLRLNTTEVKDF